MNKKQVLAYYKKYSNNNYSNENAIAFTNMLMCKANWTAQTGKTVFAYDRKRTTKELEQIYCLAEDLMCDMPELRGY